jgi:hypothetical protein
MLRDMGKPIIIVALLKTKPNTLQDTDEKISEKSFP